eukprot:TRINITY_DN4297_c0_g4_i1.p1 TRINITY_DN4297_c0_g4~~TRINITY_DN4297_c0_g4_i1.p1  ORF type:complete len:220 (+),score=7.21 TRINITY_DN4297_c0_g4_i1:120-779(+)
MSFWIIFTHFGLFFIPISFVLFILEPSILFYYHPTCMLIAFVLIMSEGIIVSRYINSFNSTHRSFWLAVHYWLQISALAVSLLGLIIIFYTKALEGRPHLQSWHSIFGILTLLSTLTQVLLGLRIYYSSHATIGSLQILTKLKTYHKLWGNITYICGMWTVCLGLYSLGYQEFFGNWIVWLGFIGLMGLAVRVLTLTPRKAKIWRVDEEVGYLQINTDN